MTRRKHSALVAAGLLALTLTGVTGAEDQGLRVLVPANPKSFHKDPALHPIASLLTLNGAADKEGTYHYRARFPSGLKLPPHRNAKDQFVTLVKGIYWLGSGERYNPMKMQELQAGASFFIPAGTPTYAWARTEVILHVLTEGGGTSPITYVNPDDDPREQ